MMRDHPLLATLAPTPAGPLAPAPLPMRVSTWLACIGANAPMAAWLYEHNGHRLNRAVMGNTGSTAMCIGMAALIAWLRVCRGT